MGEMDQFWKVGIYSYVIQASEKVLHQSRMVRSVNYILGDWSFITAVGDAGQIGPRTVLFG